MDIAKRFEEATAYATVNISSLGINKLYPTVNTKRITTKYGPSVLLSIRESEARLLQLFLPKRHCAMISDGDMDKINNKAVSINFVCTGLCETSKSYLLGIKYYILHYIHSAVLADTPSTHENSRHTILGSKSLFETQHFLVNGNIAGNVIWLPHFTPTRLGHLRFVNQLLQTFCALDICCALTGICPA